MVQKTIGSSANKTVTYVSEKQSSGNIALGDTQFSKLIVFAVPFSDTNYTIEATQPAVDVGAGNAGSNYRNGAGRTPYFFNKKRESVEVTIAETTGGLPYISTTQYINTNGEIVTGNFGSGTLSGDTHGSYRSHLQQKINNYNTATYSQGFDARIYWRATGY